MTNLLFSGILLFGSNEGSLHLPEGVSKALLASHSGMRYLIIILMLMAIFFAYQTSKGKRPFIGNTKKTGMFTMILIDIQLLMGLVLYFFFLAGQTNFKLGKLKDQLEVSMFRSIAVDHFIGMLIAVVLVHMGYAKAKKAMNDPEAGRKQFLFYLIAFIIIMLVIPWPFLHHERGWM